MMEDESTDDELGVNLQLGERLQINRQPHSSYHNTRSKTRSTKEHKEYWNGRKKDMSAAGASSTIARPHSPDAATVNGWFYPETPSPHHLGNKKRQNRDRNGEQIAKSKRTCFNICPSFKDNRVQSRQYKEMQDFLDIPNEASNLLGTTAISEPSTSYAPNGASDFLRVQDLNNLDSFQKAISPDEKYQNFMDHAPSFSEIDGTNSSSSNFSNTDLLHGSVKQNGSSTLRAFDASLSFPSTSSSGQSLTDTLQGCKSRNTNGIPLGVQFIDSESEENNLFYMELGALKGGKQPEINQYKRPLTAECTAQISDSSDDSENIQYRNKVIGNCGRQAVKSESESDDSAWQPAFLKHRSRLLLSESEESISEPSQSLLSGKHHYNHLKKPDSHCSSHFDSFKSTIGAFVPSCDQKSDDDYNDFATSCCSTVKSTAARKSPKKPSRPRKETHSKTNKHHSACSCVSEEAPIQSKPHRSGSPHPRSLRQRRHPRGLSRTSATNKACHSSQRKPRPFKGIDVDDSSDVEFFSANSYSGNEDGEPLTNIDITSNGAHSDFKDTTQLASELTLNLPVSSEDEVSIIFSANPPFRDANNSRHHHRHRGTARRRPSRVTGRVSRSQEPTCVSPDPVEQVRQMEEDERLARLLQAEFDAEVVPQECGSETHLHHHSLSTDSEENEDIRTLAGTDLVSIGLDPYTTLYAHPPIADAPSPDLNDHQGFHSPQHTLPSLHRGRYRGRQRMAIFSFQSAGNGVGRGRNNRRRHMHGDPWMFQFARIMGQTLAGRVLDSENVDYEALWDLAEDVGEVVPRGLNKAEINRLPTRKFFTHVSSGDASSSRNCDEPVHRRTELNKECQVCLCDYENNDLLRLLPCFHEFHTTCIDPWLKINRTCPVCRVEVDLEEN